jgi:hypothetical protein
LKVRSHAHDKIRHPRHRIGDQRPGTAQDMLVVEGVIAITTVRMLAAEYQLVAKTVSQIL